MRLQAPARYRGEHGFFVAEIANASTFDGAAQASSLALAATRLLVRLLTTSSAQQAVPHVATDGKDDAQARQDDVPEPFFRPGVGPLPPQGLGRRGWRLCTRRGARAVSRPAGRWRSCAVPVGGRGEHWVPSYGGSSDRSPIESAPAQFGRSNHFANVPSFGTPRSAPGGTLTGCGQAQPYPSSL